MDNNKSFDIKDYTYDELLKMFNLDLNYTNEDLKNVKKKVLMTHPDKSNLSPEYFRFYVQVYEILLKMREYRELTEKRVNCVDRERILLEKELDANNSKIESFRKMNLLTNNNTATNKFNKVFNTMFDEYLKRIKNEEEDDDNSEKFLKSNEGEIPEGLSENEVLKLVNEKRNKLKMGQLVVFQELESNYFSNNSNLSYENVKKAYTESIIPVDESDYDNKKKYNSVQEIQADRNKMLNDLNEEIYGKIKNDCEYIKELQKQKEVKDYFDYLNEINEKKNIAENVINQTILRINN